MWERSLWLCRWSASGLFRPPLCRSSLSRRIFWRVMLCLPLLACRQADLCRRGRARPYRLISLPRDCLCWCIHTRRPVWLRSLCTDMPRRANRPERDHAACCRVWWGSPRFFPVCPDGDIQGPLLLLLSTSVCYVFENVNVIIPLTPQPRLWITEPGLVADIFANIQK